MIAATIRKSLPLHTERLLLRSGRDDDVGAVLAYCGNDDVTRHLPFDSLDRAGVVARIERWRAELVRDPEDDLEHDWAPTLVVEHDGVAIGDVMLRLKAGEVRTLAEIGYVFDPAHGGKGLATEAVRAVVDLAFTRLDCHRVFAMLDPRNTASSRLCERLGMTHEAHLRRDYWGKGEWSDTAIYGLLREEWKGASQERPSSAADFSRISTLRTLPVTVIGKSSTTIT